MAYYLFTKAIIERTPVEIYNYGKMKRDFTYIDDIIQGLVASIDLGAYCEIFNLGTHQSIELLRFVEILEQEIGIEAIKTYLPMQSGDVIETYADIEHSKEKLNFIPQISIEEGLSRFVAWYKEYYSI